MRIILYFYIFLSERASEWVLSQGLL